MKKHNFFYYLAALVCSTVFAAPAAAIDIAEVDKLVPSLPGANDYACMAYSDQHNAIFSQCFAPASDNSEDKVKEFKDNVGKAKEALEKEKHVYQEKNQDIAANAEASTNKSAANQKLKQMSGMNIDVDSLEKMSDEQKMSLGHKMAANKMSQIGQMTGMMGGMSQEEMARLSKMSEKERETYMMQKMSGNQGTGLSVSEMQKFSNMSDKEFEAYAKTHPEVIEKVKNSSMGKMAASNARRMNAQSQKGQIVDSMKGRTVASKQAHKKYMTALEHKNMKEAQKQIEALFEEKYKAGIKQARENYSSCYSKYSSKGYIMADSLMDPDEEKKMKIAEKNCSSQRTWDTHYQEFTKQAGVLWAKAVRQDLAVIKAISANGTLKKLKIEAYYSNFTSSEMKNYVDNIPGIDGTEEYIGLLKEAGNPFVLPKEADFCDQAWLAKAKSIETASEKNEFYTGHVDSLRGCSEAQLKAVGITNTSPVGKKKPSAKYGRNGQNGGHNDNYMYMKEKGGKGNMRNHMNGNPNDQYMRQKGGNMGNGMKGGKGNPNDQMMQRYGK